MESFQELGLPDFLAQNLQRMNFMKPTPVQAQAIPAALQGKDVIASAQTGTGKTAAFGIPLLNFLESHKDKSALVLAPTRELAMQVLDVLKKLSGHHPLGGSVLLIGGAPMGPQLTILSRKPRLVIGTPGRVIDHLNRGSLSLANAAFLVLDEADRMLDMGFAPQLEEIRKRLQGGRQTLLFSATYPPDIQKMGANYLKDPVRITVGPSTQPVPKIAQMVIHLTEANKPAELVGELNERQGSVLIFARTQHRVDRIMDRLKEQGFKVTRIHGGRSQSQRRQAIDHFREGHYRILVATDIAARGLDIHHIAHVINYDLPRNPEDYIHRVGRTARAGAEGSSLSFLTGEDRDLWQRILRMMKVPADSIQNKPSRFGDQTPKPASGHPVTQGKVQQPGRPAFRPKGQFQGPKHGHHREGNQRPFEKKPFHREDRHREHRRAEGGHGQRHEYGQRREQGPASQRQEHGPKKQHFQGGFQGQRHPQQGGEFNRFQKRDRPFDKQRHPDGRHERRSEQHQNRAFERPPRQEPSPEIFREEDDRQPMDNRSVWQRPDQNPFFQKKEGGWKGGQHHHRSGGNGQERREGNFKRPGGFKKHGFKPRHQGGFNGPDRGR